jgi:hypothetical protein
MEDGFNCRSNASDDPYLVYTSRYDIKLVRLEKVAPREGDIEDEEFFFEIGRQTIPLIAHLRNTIALDYYYNKTDGSAILFWSDISMDQIYKGRLHQGSKLYLKLISKVLKKFLIQ